MDGATGDTMNFGDITDTGAAALAYAARGLPVLPLHYPLSHERCSCTKLQCTSIGKHPRTLHGVMDATTDVDIIHSWFSAWPESNIAVATGNGVLVIDEDAAGALEQWLGDRELPETFTTRTGKGRHIWLRADVKISNKVRLAPNIDIRGDRGYVVVPPSVHVSGVLYEVEIDTPIADAPSWLLELLTPKAPAAPIRPKMHLQFSPTSVAGESARLHSYAASVLRNATSIIRSSTEGTRNDTLNTQSFLLGTILSASWSHGLSEAVVEAQLYSAAKEAGLTDRETLKTIRSGLTAGAKQPRQLPVSRDEIVHSVRASAAAARQMATEQAKTEQDADTISALRDKLIDGLAKTQKGAIQKTSSNLYKILLGEPELSGSIVYDAFANRVALLHKPPFDASSIGGEPFVRGRAWRDADDTRLKVWLQDVYGVSWPIEEVSRTVNAIAEANVWHPIREKLDALSWDGHSRVDTWLVDYLGAADTAYNRLVGRLWLIAAVARVYQPGCKAEDMLILEGSQGIGKSTALAAVALQDDWFSDSPVQISEMEKSASAIQGKWIIEMAELASLSRTETETIKSFLSRRIDHYRAPYEKRATSVARQCIFAGSTNSSQYLKDATGNRRFWPIVCTPSTGQCDIQGLLLVRYQMWAEAVALYRAGEVWWIQDTHQDALREATEVQAQKTEMDPWVEMLSSLVEDKHMQYTIQDVADALDLPAKQIDNRTYARMLSAMQQLGYVKKQVRKNGTRTRVFVLATSTVTSMSQPVTPVTPMSQPVTLTACDTLSARNDSNLHLVSHLSHPIFSSSSNGEEKKEKRGEERVGILGVTAVTAVTSVDNYTEIAQDFVVSQPANALLVTDVTAVTPRDSLYGDVEKIVDEKEEMVLQDTLGSIDNEIKKEQAALLEKAKMVEQRFFLRFPKKPS
jgi:predicted P-loop ATPase